MRDRDTPVPYTKETKGERRRGGRGVVDVVPFIARGYPIREDNAIYIPSYTTPWLDIGRYLAECDGSSPQYRCQPLRNGGYVPG